MDIQNPFLSADVPDPTDFPHPSEAPGLRTLDTALRCPICGEVYDAPVSIACGHTFCSACIRSALGVKQECPQCRKTANEVHIRVNHTIEAVISSWKEARPFVLTLIQNETKRKASEALPDASSRKRRRRERSSSVELVEAGPSTQAQSSLRSPTKPKSSSVKPRSNGNIVPSSDAEEDEEIAKVTKNAPDEATIVQCPICQTSLKYRHLNQHIDSGCTSFKNDVVGMKDASRSKASSASNGNGKKEKDAWSSIFGGGGGGKNKKKSTQRDDTKDDDEDPLPMATYATLKDRQLKDMLLECELWTSGDRGMWEERHKRWVMMYNANLDRTLSNRKKKSELRRELKKWEEERARKRKVVVGDVVAYQKEHKSEFSKLVNAARQSAQTIKKRETSTTSSSPLTANSNGSEPHTTLSNGSERHQQSEQHVQTTRLDSSSSGYPMDTLPLALAPASSQLSISGTEVIASSQ
ncbi:hypothetical protein CVT24_013333 [Panaeolus cyanescens]|uniref:Postreplication repair E3 ubiquitin-protein ligase RAD18 n=1 Tax=Panaeolus cyanescens TaxID=181874 RepID=A0A409WAE5_9AGAR|nr:hypothetical protein CVT24_013333 [Panaeolus cyanescens]